MDLQEPTLDTMPLQAPHNLPSLVKTAFDRARAGGSLVFYPTQVVLLQAKSVPFQLRFSPALASKPVHPQRHDTAAAAARRPPPPPNPFADPDPALVVARLGDAHNLVLNKFAIVPEHFILATREFAPQTHVLEREDLGATYACIRAYQRGCLLGGNDGEQQDGQQQDGQQDGQQQDGQQDGQQQDGQQDGDDNRGELFAFFNSGPHSGASQPHRHIQLLPVERMRDGLDPEGRRVWNVLADRLGTTISGEDADTDADTDLSFETFHASISPATTPVQLHEIYLSLLHRATVAVARFHHVPVAREHDGGDCHDSTAPETTTKQQHHHQQQQQHHQQQHEIPRAGEEARISYNLAMTARSLVICPRLAEGAVLTARGEDGEMDVVGTMAMNGTVLAGTALVKNEREWAALRADEGVLRRMLGGIGVPRG